jgi:hypothetical protein
VETTRLARGVLEDPVSPRAWLIIQTIRRDPSGSDQIDDPSNVSRLDPSGADQIDAEHPPRKRKVAPVPLYFPAENRRVIGGPR